MAAGNFGFIGAGRGRQGLGEPRCPREVQECPISRELEPGCSDPPTQSAKRSRAAIPRQKRPGLWIIERTQREGFRRPRLPRGSGRFGNGRGAGYAELRGEGSPNLANRQAMSALAWFLQDFALKGEYSPKESTNGRQRPTGVLVPPPMRKRRTSLRVALFSRLLSFRMPLWTLVVFLIGVGKHTPYERSGGHHYGEGGYPDFSSHAGSSGF